MNITDSLRGTLALQSAQREQAKTAASDDMQSRFLTLLTTQLKNQDPTSPMENAELTSQLAQMSTVDGIERLNSLFSQLMTERKSMDTVQAATMIGKGVLIPGTSLPLTAQGALGGFELDGYAEKVEITIRDASGNEMAKLEQHDLKAGTHNFIWDGLAANGQKAIEGSYSVELKAALGGEDVKVIPLEIGVVTSVVKGPNSVDFQVGDRGIYKIDEIRQVL